MAEYGQKKVKKSEPTSPSSEELIQTLASALSLQTAKNVTVMQEPQPPAPEKYHTGDDFDRWAARTMDYLDFFPAEKRLYILKSLLDDECYDLVMYHHEAPVTVTESTFKTLRSILASPKLARKYRDEFRER